MKVVGYAATYFVHYRQIQTSNGAGQDVRLKSIRGKIEDVRMALQRLSNTEGVPLEEKAKQRKELQKNLQELSRQMLQRRLEIQQEKRDKLAGEVAEDMQEQSKASPDRQVFGAPGIGFMPDASDGERRTKRAAQNGRADAVPHAADVLEDIREDAHNQAEVVGL